MRARVRTATPPAAEQQQAAARTEPEPEPEPEPEERKPLARALARAADQHHLVLFAPQHRPDVADSVAEVASEASSPPVSAPVVADGSSAPAVSAVPASEPSGADSRPPDPGQTAVAGWAPGPAAPALLPAARAARRPVRAQLALERGAVEELVVPFAEVAPWQAAVPQRRAAPLRQG